MRSWDDVSAARRVLGDHGDCRTGEWALCVQVGQVLDAVAAEHASQPGRAPLGQPTPREASNSLTCWEGVVREQACVVPELGGEALAWYRGCGGCVWRSPRQSRGRPCSGSGFTSAFQAVLSAARAALALSRRFHRLGAGSQRFAGSRRRPLGCGTRCCPSGLVECGEFGPGA